jgi:hypothetical protein
MVVIAGYPIETPRLLLNPASSRFPDGLCNDFDQVGRYLMVQGAPQTAGRFDAEVRMYKAPGSANPALTIMAVAARAADHLIAGAAA